MLAAGERDRAGAVLPEDGLRRITDREFGLFQTLIHGTAGISLGPAKKELLMGRLGRRLRQLNLTTYGAYFEYATQRHPEELVHLLDAICTHETSFFRERYQFDFLEQQVFPLWKASPQPWRIRAWSAGCATGEEPYSLAMTLRHHFPPGSGWGLEVLGTDLSTRAVERARAAIWPVQKAKEIPVPYLRAFMLRGTGSQQGMMKAVPELSECVRIERLNLNAEAYPAFGLFDLIFCRNVLIYFSAEIKARVVQRLLSHLAPAGLLFLGHAEGLSGMTDQLYGLSPTVYRRADLPHGDPRTPPRERS